MPGTTREKALSERLDRLEERRKAFDERLEKVTDDLTAILEQLERRFPQDRREWQSIRESLERRTR
jgi:hypothetical protein